MATVMNDDQLEFDLGSEEKATNVTLGEEPVEQSNEEPPQKVETPTDSGQSHKQELDAVNDTVQKRIAKLTARMREAERREQAALDYAKGLQTQAQELQQKLVHTDYSRLNEAKARLDTQQSQLRAIIAKAREEGDLNTEIEAQERLATLVHEQRQVAAWLQDPAANPQNYQQQVQQQAQPQYQQPPQQQFQPPQQQFQQPQQPAKAADPRAEEWAARNSWFGQDRMMTYAAWGIHQQLIEEEGIDPSSDEYYTELDQRLRNEFPKRFAGEQSPTQSSRQQRSAPAVAPATRSSGVNSVRRTVRLSPSQVAIAKKLGVPLEEYAKYVKE
jgi:hypothetical protein